MRSLLVLLLVVGCGSTSSSSGGGKPGETAAQRAKREYAESGEADEEAKGKQWGGWRYTGSRDECFYVVGRKCFSELDDACRAAKCSKKQCRTAGGGPATVSCQK